MSRAVRFTVGGVALVVLAAAGLVVAMFSSVLAGLGTDTAPGTTTTAGCLTTVGVGTGAAVLDDEQRANAAGIVSTGQALGVPERGQVIALATAMQESSLRNLDHGDRDSLGLFQQRPSQGWGTPEQVRDPQYAAARFYFGLLAVPAWDTLPVTVAAQRVQRSAYPNAYARWESLATALVSAAPGAGACADVVQASHGQGAVGVMLASALAQVGKPYVFGATGPGAFDCSGLVVYAWRQAGYRLTVRTADQMYRSSTPVAPGQEQPGDLVFRQFGTRVPGAGHVLVVVEPGLAVEAPATGLDVRVRPYDPFAAGQTLGRLDPSVLVPLEGAVAGTRG